MAKNDIDNLSEETNKGMRGKKEAIPTILPMMTLAEVVDIEPIAGVEYRAFSSLRPEVAAHFA